MMIALQNISNTSINRNLIFSDFAPTYKVQQNFENQIGLLLTRDMYFGHKV